MVNELDFSEVVSHFNFEGQFIKAEPYGCGHIHDTFAVFFQNNNNRQHRWILQRINHRVFKNPDELMLNIDAVTSHLHSKISETGGNPERQTLTIIPTNRGETYHQTDDGNYWRAYIFIEGAQTYQVPSNPDQVYNAGRAFGRFQQMLDDFPVHQLHETIPDFHNTKKRYEIFQEVLEEDKFNRVVDVQDEIDFVMSHDTLSSTLVNLLETRALPLRVTMNDCKFNNVMIDDTTGEGVAVIDLDTVMPGSLLYDFGDAIRSITNTAQEDEPDLSKVRFSMEAFEQYTRGYLDETRDALTDLETANLVFSARLMTFECGMRFLTDYLNGDQYFKIQRAHQNLDRARTQFKLIREMEGVEQAMEHTIDNYS